MRPKIISIGLMGLPAALLLAGCHATSTIGQAIASASPPATEPTIGLVCSIATCARAAHPASSPKNSLGDYMVLPARPFFYVEATYPQLLALTVDINHIPLALLSGGSVSDCHPAGCAFYTTETTPQNLTKAKISIVPPDSVAAQERLTVGIGTKSLNPATPSTAIGQISVAVIRPGAPINVTAAYSPTAGGHGGISVDWVAPQAAPVDYYEVDRGDGFNASFYGNPATSAYVDANVQAGATYQYVVRGWNTSGEGPASNFATVSVPQASGSGGSGGATMTCDNKTPTTSAANFIFGVENPATKCLTNVVSVLANNQSDGQSCVKAAAVANAVIGPAAQLAQFFFALYQPDGAGGYYCSTTNTMAFSGGDAQACARAGCNNCTAKDITSQVFANGQISASYSTWCTDHPTP